MDFERVNLTHDGPAAIITLNRPDVRNCVDRRTLEEISAALDSCESDDGVRVVVLTGAGEVFSSGADLKYLRAQDAKGFADFIRLYHAVCARIESLAKPAIAAVNGLAIAGGLELVLACDLVVMSESAELGDHHAKIGAIPGGGSSQRLPRAIGTRRAKELIMTGRRITAQEAQALGLASRVVPPAELMAAVMELALALAEKDPWVLKTVKHLINAGTETDLATGLRMEERAITERRFEPERRSGRGEEGIWTSG